jgi:hypothetical protein
MPTASPRPLTIDATDIPHPGRPPDTLAERLARLRALLDRADALRAKPDLSAIEAELSRLERLLAD